ncbi:TonB-dependent receptor domain-containing protein [Desulfurispira natronophila]|uniref:Vitamin B12 transporter n=1 Tax=Desulfurispira natronophila TaxID=682562 RepID=A0A7W8DH85_9BACT|nr:TonB-dependent receptor [Desulfurispira natronophila]MBB5022127.1 vitamin B12 transporter [Desulfurispira natronophila]
MSRLTTSLSRAALVCALVPTIILAADSAPEHEEEQVFQIVVTATRTLQPAEETLAPVTVITREEIERGQYQSLPDVLANVPGVQVNRSGGLGKQTRVSLRGTDTKHTILLIDGVRIHSATLGGASFEYIPLSQIDRVEVVRGPRSTLYGADAVGGVIQVFTRSGEAGTRGEVTVGGGSHGTAEGQAFFATASGNSHYSLGVGHLRSDGIDAQKNDVPTSSGNTPDESDKDGYKENSLSLRLGHEFSPGNSIEFTGLHTEGESEYDGSAWSPNATDFVQQALGLTLHLLPTDTLSVTLQGSQSQDRSKNFQDGDFFSLFETKQQQFSVQGDLFLRDSDVLTIGSDYTKDKVRSNTDYDENSRDNSALFTQYQLEHMNHSILVGVRYDDNEQFGSHTTYNAGYGLRLPHDLKLGLNYGTAFRAPTFNELYWPIDPVWGGGGNPDLKPEESTSYEISLQQSLPNAYWSASVFRTNIENMISGQPTKNTKARIDGIELDGGYRLTSQWNISATITLQDPKDRESGNLLARRSEQMATVNLDGDFGKTRVGVTAQGFSERYDDGANTLRLPGYGLLHLRGEYDIATNWLLQARIENVLDKEYEEVATYNTPGRSAYLYASYRF